MGVKRTRRGELGHDGLLPFGVNDRDDNGSHSCFSRDARPEPDNG
jgi:hypothetical protein